VRNPPKLKRAKEKEYAGTVQPILSLLHKWGIHTLGDFIRLNQEEIRARLGCAAVRLWERAQGKSTRLLKFVQPPESFLETFEFEYEVETVEPLLFVLQRFLQQLAVRLNGVYRVTKELSLGIHFSHKESYERRFQIPQPTNDVDLLFRMLQTHLEDFQSEYPITAVALEALPAEPVPQQFGLFETTLRNPNQLYETLARLIGLLGADRVGTPVLEDTYRPDSFRLEPFCWELNEDATAIALESTAALRRFRPSLPASLLFERDQPIHFRSAELSGSVVAQTGPYVASGNWWDDKTWSHHEWDIELQKGAVFQCHSRDGKWELDGIYD
jgi:protein ImuB